MLLSAALSQGLIKLYLLILIPMMHILYLFTVKRIKAVYATGHKDIEVRWNEAVVGFMWSCWFFAVLFFWLVTQWHRAFNRKITLWTNAIINSLGTGFSKWFHIIDRFSQQIAWRNSLLVSYQCCWGSLAVPQPRKWNLQYDDDDRDYFWTI